MKTEEGSWRPKTKERVLDRNIVLDICRCTLDEYPSTFRLRPSVVLHEWTLGHKVRSLRLETISIFTSVSLPPEHHRRRPSNGLGVGDSYSPDKKYIFLIS